MGRDWVPLPIINFLLWGEERKIVSDFSKVSQYARFYVLRVGRVSDIKRSLASFANLCCCRCCCKAWRPPSSSRADAGAASASSRTPRDARHWTGVAWCNRCKRWQRQEVSLPALSRMQDAGLPLPDEDGQPDLLLHERGGGGVSLRDATNGD